MNSSRDIVVTRYGGDDYAPEGGESLFLADFTKFKKSGPPCGVEILDRYESDVLNVRVRCGELDDQEETEWITRHSFRLANPSGVLALGSWFPDFYGPEAPYVHRPWWTEVQGASTISTVVVYTYLPFLIARGGLIEAMSMPEVHSQIRPWGCWFRETRPDREMPDWLVRQCIDWPGIDPGHEGEWKGRSIPSGEIVEVLINLLSEGEPIPPDKQRELTKFPMGIQVMPDRAV